MRLFGGQQVSNLMQRLNIDDMVPIAHGIVDRTIEQAQNRVEGAHFDTRKHLLEYDDVLNQQREIFYTQRNRVFSKDDLLEDVEDMLVTEVEAHVESALADPEGPWKLLAWLEETQPTLNLNSDSPYPSFMLQVLLDELDDVQDVDVLHERLLEIAADALEAQYEHLARAVDQQLESSIDRLDEQAEQRINMAEMAIEGAIVEAEESGRAPSPRQLLESVQSAAGMKIQADDESVKQLASDPETFRRRIPDLVEASLGLRIWSGLVQSIEHRIGESLNLDQQMSLPIDWAEAGQRLQDALHDVWQERIERVLEEIDRDLETALRNEEEVDKPLKTRLLVQMSYSQRMVFDKKSHQRKSTIVARLSYAFSAANLIEAQSVEDLTDRVLDHLEGAQEALYRTLGLSELQRVVGTGVADLDERYQRALRRTLGEERFEELAEEGPVDSLDERAREEVTRLVGQTMLTDGYRQLILSVGDRLWVDYLTQMEALRTSIGLEAYGQRDPLVQYKSRAYDMFQELLANIRSGVVSRLFRTQPVSQAQAVAAPTARAANAQAAAQQASQVGGNQDQNRRRRRRRRRR